MANIEQEISDTLEKYLKNNNLNLKNIEACEYILDKYKNKLHINSLTCRLTTYICSIDDKYNIKDIDVISCENFSSNGETVDKIAINFKDNILNVKYEMVNSVYFAPEGKVTVLVHKFYINNCLIFKHGTNDKKIKNSINLTYIEECVNKLGLNISLYEFLSALTRLFGTRVFDPLVQKVGTESDREKYFFNKNWDSDSNVSSADSD